MKIAYLTSQYPAVSHTFIMREVHALRDLGFNIGTFSVRRASAQDCLDQATQDELDKTKWLLPIRIAAFARACGWATLTRPWLTARTLAWAVLSPGSKHGGRLKWLAYFLEAVQLARWLERDGFDHLHCHFGNAGSSAGMLAASIAGIPFSITCHGSELRDIDKHRLLEKVDAAAFLACVTHFGKVQLMMACPPTQWRKLEIIRCGAPPCDAAQQDSANDTAKAQNILCVGRLSREKGHVILLEALASLHDRGVAFTCTLVGNGPLRSEVEQHIDRLKLTNSVTLTGALAPDEVAKHYAIASVVVLASFSEGAPVVLMEAMAHGRPVVATNVGGVSELVEHGRTGTLVAPGNAAALAQAIKNVFDHPDVARTKTDAAKRHVAETFNVEESAKRMGTLFQQAQAPQPAADALHDTEASPC